LLFAIALVLALVGGGIAVACQPAAPVAAEVDPGDGFDVTAAHDAGVAAICAPRTATVVAPPLATLTPRHHVDLLFRPPRG
jgi:hypothetical protein